MTREVAKNIIRENTSKKSKEIVIDMIYDAFESRVCENCKHSDKLHSMSGEHIGYDCEEELLEEVFSLPLGFGCNKWEKTDD